MRPTLSDRVRWPMYTSERQNWTAARDYSNLAVPGLDQQGSETRWSIFTGSVQSIPPTLQPAYGTFYDSSPNSAGGWGGPGAGPGVTGIWGGILNILSLDPSRDGEATPGKAPVLATAANPSMNYQQPPSLGSIAYKIPAGP